MAPGVATAPPLPEPGGSVSRAGAQPTSPGGSPPDARDDDGERADCLDAHLRRALGRAVGVVSLAAGLLFAGGELGIGWEIRGGSAVITLHGLFSPWAAGLWPILAWDLLLGTALLFLAGRTSCRGRAGENLLGLGVTLTLWRLVFLAALPLLAGSGRDLPLLPARDLLPLWMVAGVLLAGKEDLARSLLLADHRDRMPLLRALAWHHRKDGVFFLLFALALTWGVLGGSASRADLVLNLVKIVLLGGAADGLTRQFLWGGLPGGERGPAA